MDTYIIIFNTPQIPTSIRIGYEINKVEQSIPNPLRCYKSQKFGHHEDVWRGVHICKRCGGRSPDHNQNKCSKNHNCAKCKQDHPTYAQYEKKEKT